VVLSPNPSLSESECPELFLVSYSESVSLSVSLSVPELLFLFPLFPEFMPTIFLAIFSIAFYY
jgi:hypothetical protein